MKSKRVLLTLLLALLVPWAAMAQQTLPYSYGFEDNDLSADGWTKVTTSSSSGIYNAGTSAYEGSKLFRFHYSENPAYLVSPQLSGTTNGVDVAFYYKQSSSSYVEQFQVGYTTDANNTTPSTYSYGTTIYTTTTWTPYENTFPANTKYIAIKYIYTNGLY